MQLLYKAFLTLAILIQFIKGQEFSLGNCNANIETKKDFNPSKFDGKWYTIQRSFMPYEAKSTCCRVIFNHVSYSSDEHIYRTYYTFMVDNKEHELPYVLDDDDVKNGKMVLKPGYISDELPVRVLDTDYKTYVIYYGCKDAYNGKLEFVWVMFPQAHPESDVVDKAVGILRERGVNVILYDVVQNCADI